MRLDFLAQRFVIRRQRGLNDAFGARVDPLEQVDIAQQLRRLGQNRETKKNLRDTRLILSSNLVINKFESSR